MSDYENCGHPISDYENCGHPMSDNVRKAQYDKFNFIQ